MGIVLGMDSEVAGKDSQSEREVSENVLFAY